MTLLGIGLSAWLVPAFTRQWDDRQKAHELKAALVTEMASATAQVLTDGRDTTFRRAGLTPSDRTRRLGIVPMSSAERNWSIANLRIQAKLRAYFPNDVGAWRAFGYLMGVAASVASGRYQANVPAYPPDSVMKSYLNGRSEFTSTGNTVTMLQHGLIFFRTAGGSIKDRVVGLEDEYNAAADALLVLEERVSTQVLADHPAGYSTTWHDLVHDLIP